MEWKYSKQGIAEGRRWRKKALFEKNKGHRARYTATALSVWVVSSQWCGARSHRMSQAIQKQALISANIYMELTSRRIVGNTHYHPSFRHATLFLAVVFPKNVRSLWPEETSSHKQQDFCNNYILMIVSEHDRNENCLSNKSYYSFLSRNVTRNNEKTDLLLLTLMWIRWCTIVFVYLVHAVIKLCFRKYCKCLAKYLMISGFISMNAFLYQQDQSTSRLIWEKCFNKDATGDFCCLLINLESSNPLLDSY